MRTHVEDYGEVKLDADGNIRLDLPCAVCGYNLRGLAASGHCPECGEPKSISYRLRKFTLRWRLLPAVPLAGTSMLLAAANYYCQIWYSGHGWAGPSKYPFWHRIGVAFATLSAPWLIHGVLDHLYYSIDVATRPAGSPGTHRHIPSVSRFTSDSMIPPYQVRLIASNH